MFRGTGIVLLAEALLYLYYVKVGEFHHRDPDASMDVIVSKLCLHKIYDRPTRLASVRQVARVLAPGGVALLSDYKRTGEYAAELRACGLTVERRHGSWANFPHLRIVVARKSG